MADENGNSRLNQWLNAQKNPAAPAGMQQQGESAAQAQGGGESSGNSRLNQWLSQTTPTEGAKSWFTGANREGTNNGWETGFVDSFVSGWGAALEQGTAREYFEKPDATGVVTWDHTSTDGTRQYRFGDVYENGKKVANLYDPEDGGFDRETANLMMAPWILDNDVQARAFSASDRTDRLDREIRTAQADRNQNFEKSLSAMEFAEDVDARQGKIQSGAGDEAMVAAAALAGGGMGAGVGSVIPGVGTLLGGVGGAIVGGVGAWMNRDQLAEEAARAYEITRMSFRDNNNLAATGTALAQFSGVGARLISPGSNLVQGSYDVFKGRGGDGESEFYRVDETGRSTTPGWVKAADVTASVGDALLQFSSAAGLRMFTTQMSGMIGGEVTQLAASGGETFDYRRGGFDNIFTDDDGNFDALSAAAGIGKVGIDAVQLGMARGLVGKANAARAEVGETAAYRTAAARFDDKLPIWAGGSRGLAQGEERVRAAGFSFTRGADGQIVEGSRRATLGLLAPSEQLGALSARVLATREAARRGGAVSSDDFYRAAHAMSVGERKFTSAVVNGMGEGYEEAMQAVLEPLSHNAAIDFDEVVNSALYGAAAGVGMSMGASLRSPSADERMFAMAQTAQLVGTSGVELTRAQWAGMTPVERRQLASLSGMNREVARAAFAKIDRDLAIDVNAGVVGAAKLKDAVQSELSRSLAAATDRTDGAFVVTQLEEVPRVDELGNLLPGAMPADAVGASALQTMANIDNHLRGIRIQAKTLEEDVVRLTGQVTDNPEDTDARAELDRVSSLLARTDLTLEWGVRFNEVLDQYMERIHSPETTFETLNADVAELNDLLRRAFNRELHDYQGQVLTSEDKTALAHAVSMVFARDPHDSAGSYQMLVPQVSARLTAAKTDNLLEISHAILPAIRGDFDGDKVRPLNQVILDETAWTSARSGAHFVGAGASVNVGTPKYEQYNVEQMSQALSGNNVTLAGVAELALQNLAGAVRKRYDGVVDDVVLDEALDGFFTAVRANDKDARTKLLDGLAEKAGGAVTEFARANLSNEWLWLDQVIVSTFQGFQEAYAAHRPDLSETPDSRVSASKHARESEVRTRKAERAATLGQWLGQISAGDTLFRKFQKLHYTVIGSPVLSAENIEPASLTEMAMLYRELGSQVTRTELENIRGKDDITGRVLVQLQKLALDAQRMYPQLNRGESMAVVANLKVWDIETNEQGEFVAGHEISLAQMLLKQSLMVDRREKDGVWEASPELQAKHARLSRMTRPNSRDYPDGAEQAFVEVVGSQQMYAILGDDAAIFGPHLTVEQFIRQYSALSTLDRRDMARALKSEPAYLGRRASLNPPYGLDEAVAGELSAYRAVVDAVLAVGNGRIAIDEATGVLSGEIAARSDRVGKDFRDAHTRVRAALAEFAGITGRKDGELTIEMVQRLLEGNPDFGRQVMNLIPNAAANAALMATEDGSIVAHWLYETFVLADAKQAEMHYWRSLMLTEWNALGRPTPEEGETGESGRRYDRLPRRMHRILYKLAAENDNGTRLKKFVDTLASATDLEAFIRWVNTTPGIKGEQAPLTAWVDDVAEFDVDKAQGGWTSALPGAELREAITTLRAGSENLVSSLAEERAALKADIRTLASIRRVIKKDRGDEVTLDAGDRELYNAFAKTIELAGERNISLGPQAMIYQTVGAVQGFYSSAHTKGKNPPNVEPAGAFDAFRDALDYTTNYERLMASLTASNLDAVGANLNQAAKDSLRAMDDYGRTVEWDQPTPEQMLALLEDPDTRPFARAVLFPQVMERGPAGQLLPQFLVGKSLDSLLRGSSFKEMFPRNGRLSQDAALRYVAMVEGTARKFGGHLSVQRTVNDLVIARTSAADHALSEREIESMTVSAYHEVAQVLQGVGSIAAAPATPGTDPLADILTEVRTMQRRLRMAKGLGLIGESAELTDVALSQFVQDREREALADKTELLDTLQGVTDEAEIARVMAQVEAVDADLERFKARVEVLKTDDIAASVVEMFTLETDLATQASRKQMLVQYVNDHLSLLQKVPALTITVNKVTQQLLDRSRAGQVELTDKEWGALSRGVIAAYLEDVVATGAPSLAISPWPDADREADRRYYDTSFSYLVEDMLRSDGPLAQAAREVHRLAGRSPIPMPAAEFADLLGRTVLDGRKLGPWTGDIPRASIEANQRLDSAAAAPAIAMAGNSPKRQAALIAATRRTYEMPGAELLSKVKLTAADLAGDPFDEVIAELPGYATPIPLAQLNNRFARSVVASVTDPATGAPVTFDLMVEYPDLGRTWVGHESVVSSPYKEVHLDRITHALDRAAAKHGFRAAAATVEVEFFHPDSQPAGPEWYNNVYFEGTSFKLDGDRHESLLSTLWFAHGSISPAGQAAALDASKLGKPALQVIEVPGAGERAAIEADWTTNLASVLRAKARTLVETDLGFGALDVEFFNAAYKDMKLRHFVRGTDVETGEPTLWTAEQVIAAQAVGSPLPENASLWIPSDDVLRTMLGEQGTQGVARVFDDVLEVDPARVPTYRGVTPKMLEQFKHGITGGPVNLAQTRVMNRGRQSTMVVRKRLDDATRTAFETKMLYFNERETRIHQDRGEVQRTDGEGFNARTNLAATLKAGAKMLNSENIALDWASGGIPMVGPRRVNDTALSALLLRDLHAAMEQDGFRTGWVYREGVAAKPQAGLLSEVSLGAQDREAYRVAPRDLVVVELDSFAGDAELARKRIDYLASQGAILLLGATDGQGDLRAELAEYLVSDSGYEPIAGSQHAFQPGEFGSRFQNQRARVSSLMEMRGVSPRNQVAVFHTTEKAITENAAWTTGTSERLGAIGVTTNLVPADFLAGFNVPVESLTNEAQLTQVRAHLRGLDTAEGRALLRDQANGHLDGDERAAADADFDAAYQRMLDRFDQHDGVVLPQPGDTFGKGDIIPLIDSVGRVLLYRHGFKAPTRWQVDELTARPIAGRDDAANVAVYPSKPEPAATVHSGEVVEFRPRSISGLMVELNVPLSAFGDKKQLEWNGMKYVLSPKPDSIALPENGFMDGWAVDLIASLDDAVSKEAFDGMVTNHRAAFAYFGVDFLPDVTEFFFPGRGQDADAHTQALEMLHTIATRAPRIRVDQADELITADRLGPAIRELLPEGQTETAWIDKLADLTPVENRITAAMLVYLMTPGARVTDVLRSGGFNDTSSSLEAQSHLMPQLFTQVFDLAPLNSPLRKEMNDRINAQLDEGYVMHRDWTFEIRHDDPSKNMRGLLQFAEAHSAGDNPVKNGMSFDEDERQQVSQHSGDILYGATGGRQAMAHDIAKARAFASGAGVTRFGRDAEDGGVWRMLTAIPESDKSFRVHRAETPAEQARRGNAREAMVQFRQEIDQQVDSWTDKQRKEYTDLRHEVVRHLGLLDANAPLVDFWVRQTLGQPAGTDADGNQLGRVTGKGAIEAAKDIRWNVQNGYVPVIGAEVPLLHLHDLQAIYRANATNRRWAPRQSMGTDAKPAASWNEWVEVSLGTALTSDTLFDPLYLLALDGFMHGYQSATRSLMDLPVSIDSLTQLELRDPDLNRMLVSISDETNQLTFEPAMLNTARADLDALIGGQRIAGKFKGKAAPAAEVAKRRDARRKWRKENGVPVPVDVSMKNFRKNGARFVDESTTANALARGLINLRVGTALINPALYVSMGPEQWIRGTLDRAANILTGQATTGLTASAQARVSDALEGTAVGDALAAVGLTARYTPQQLAQLQELYESLGSRSDFKKMVYGDLWFQRPHEDGVGKIGRGLENYAKFGSRLQDPTWGMRADTLARRYMEAALQHIAATPTLNVISTETLIAELRTNPQFLKDNLPEAHQAGTNAIAQLRSLKSTPLSLALRGIYEPLSESSNSAVNFFGNVVLKLPMLFSGYAMNVATTITGMQGASDAVAMFLDGRKKWKPIAATQRAFRQGEINETIDMSPVIEGIDLSRSFIRGGLTHTGLFAMGLMAGGLGLSGEDEEAKRRRRLAEHQGVGHIYDPRQVENDFRNADALFVDKIPFLSSYFKATADSEGGEGRSFGQLHWMLKQFVSPIIGMEKFFETGDFRNVTWGFQDALGAFPLINTMMWGDAVETANELASMADGEAQLGGPTNLVNAGNFLTTAVGIYERMLFENSFVNQLYMGADKYDRDQYVLPLLDSDGTIQRDAQGNARPNDVALQSYVDPETGMVKQGYLGRSSNSATLHGLAENRATLALVGSLFTGGIDDSDFWRYNMPIKLREINKPEADIEEVKGQVLGAFARGGAVPLLNLTEAEAIIKNQYIARGEWYEPDEVAAQAKTLVAQTQGQAGLSLVGKDGREYLTSDGAKAIFRGIYKGAVKPSDASLAGIHITAEMREQITNEWTKELIQEGVNFGLDQTKATSRAKRIMYGDFGTSEVGLSEIIWSKEISYSDKAIYKQLNTTYVMGPDGMPWATGYTRDGLMGALGLKPLKRTILSETGATTTDGKLNTVDLVHGMNTGLRALEPLDATEYIPTDKEIGDKIAKAIEDAAGGDVTPFTPYAKNGGGSGWVNYGRGGYGGYSRRGYGGYGGGSYGGSSYFTRMNPLPDNVTPYGNNMSNVNTSNPILRRATVRRERVWSERGRLKQWQ